MNVVQEYLRLSGAYCQYLGGLRWSTLDDTLVYPDGGTFAFNEEIAVFLTGLGRQRALIHFGHVLHLLDLLRNSRALPGREVGRLRHAFADADASLANAGAFFASLCREVPEVPLAVDVQHVCARLTHPGMPIRWFIVSFHDTFHPSQGAPLLPEAFEAGVLRGVAAYSDEELRHWFRHGHGAVKDVGAEIARQLPVPRTLTGVLAALLDRPRLAGAQAYVAQLVSALTLPPRRLARQELPVGGYTDVTTHGPPEQLLLDQFALDEWDFFRRFVDRELLYYRREEPQARTRQDLVVLLDQGVRTWGEIRLVLAAAALAFGKQAGRRGTPFYLAATSRRGALLDPLQSPGDDLGRLLEASDLSANPGLALESVLEQPAAAARDVVLLTNPRSLREPDVRAAARRVAPGVRLFAVALDGAGSVDLVEMRHGAPVPVRRFKVARPAPPPPRPARTTAHAGEELGPWSGDVEPVGFPFRFGVGNPIVSFDFDYAGEWLLTATRDGMLHAYRTSGGHWEILPRGLWQGQTATRLDCLLGVRGGFVVCGGFSNRHLAFYYDFGKRTCKTHSLGVQAGPQGIRYSQEQHVLHVGSPLGIDTLIDLTSGETRSLAQPLQAFWFSGTIRELPPPSGSPMLSFKAMAQKAGFSCSVDPDTGEVRFQGPPPLAPFTPISDGLPALRGWAANAFEYRQQTLALLTEQTPALRAKRRSAKEARVLRLFRGPTGIPLASYFMRAPKPAFALSEDGERLARQTGEYWVEVNRVGGDDGLILTTRAGSFSSRLRLVLGKEWLLLATTKHHRHLVRWDGDQLELAHWHNKQAGASQDAYYFGKSSDSSRVEATKEGMLAFVYNDQERFILGAATTVLAVADRFGQVALFELDGQFICMFFAFRERIAVWMPDGTRHGPAALTGGPATHDALARIGKALCDASRRGRTRS